MGGMVDFVNIKSKDVIEKESLGSIEGDMEIV